MIDRELYLKEVNEYCGTNLILNNEDRDNWFDDVLNNLERTPDRDSPIISNFKFENITYFRLNASTNFLYCSNNNIWSILGDEFNMNHEDIRFFIKNKIENYFKLKSIKPTMRTYI